MKHKTDSPNHSLFMKRCLDLAKLGRGSVSPNPVVGAVIVHKNTIIGEGYHQLVGGLHAEIEALKSVRDASVLKEATMYVSLEPCFHFGRTPPCVDSLLNKGFKEVIICLVDPDSRVSGQSIEKLQANSVKVKIGYLKDKGHQQNAFFLCRTVKKRPYIILKYAQLSNKVFGLAGQQFWISNPYTQRLVHRWRSEIGAILVGTNTAVTDNPKLNNRLYFGTSPLRVLLDRYLKVKTTAHSLSDGQPTLVLTEKKATSSNNCEYLQLPFTDELIPHLLKILYDKGIDSLLVEGGTSTIQQFIHQGWWDEARIFTSYSNDTPLSNPIYAPTLPVASAQSFQIADNLLEVFYNTTAPKLDINIGY